MMCERTLARIEQSIDHRNTLFRNKIRVSRLVHCSLVTSLATIADAAGLWIKRGASPDRAGGLSHLLTLAFLQSSCSLATTLSHPLAPIVITPTKSTEGMLHLYPV